MNYLLFAIILFLKMKRKLRHAPASVYTAKLAILALAPGLTVSGSNIHPGRFNKQAKSRRLVSIYLLVKPVKVRQISIDYNFLDTVLFKIFLAVFDIIHPGLRELTLES